MIDDASKPDAPAGHEAGEEPAEESGAGYGNHAHDAEDEAATVGGGESA